MSDVSKVSYYAIIPANVRYDKNVCSSAKLLYGEITALCNQKGFCWASNSYFAELYGVSKTSVSKWIKQLIDGCYIKSSIEYKLNTKEILNRYLTIISYPIEEKLNTPIEEKLNTPIEEKLKDNTTVYNNTRKNNTKRAEPFADYTSNSLLSDAIKDFISMRKQIKAPMTDRAIKLMLQKLDTLAQNDDTKIAVLNQSILNSWKGIFALKDQGQMSGQMSGKCPDKNPPEIEKEIEKEIEIEKDVSSLSPILEEIKTKWESTFHPLMKAAELETLDAYIQDYGRMGVLNAIETADKRKNLNRATLSPRYLLPILKNPTSKPEEPRRNVIPMITDRNEKEYWARLRREDEARQAEAKRLGEDDPYGIYGESS